MTVTYNGADGSTRSATVTFTTSSSLTELTIGSAAFGGYYAGTIDSGTERYAVIVAPKASGENSSIQYKTSASADSGTQSM
jgi:hypothetical protein